MAKETLVTLGTVGGGGLEEIFQDLLTQAMINIQDPNTNPCEKRVITLKIVIAPDMNRRGNKVELSGTCKLAPAMPITTDIWFEELGGCIQAVEIQPYAQVEMPMFTRTVEVEQ